MYYNGSTANTGLFGLILGLGSFVIIFGLAIVVFSIIAMWKMFEKAGKEGWKSLIPGYNLVVLLEIVGLKWYYIFLYCLAFIPTVGALVSLFFTFVIMVKLAKSFGKDIAFGIGLTLVSVVFMAIIGFDKSITYVGPVCKGDIDFNNLF